MNTTAQKKAILFDMDGVLVLTEVVKAEAHVATIEKLGGSANIDLYIEMLGQSHESIRSAYLKAAEIQTDPKLYTKYYRDIYHELLENKLIVRPGARELVNELFGQGFFLAVVSSSSATSMKKIMKSIGLDGRFEVQVTSDDTKERKPDPAPYLLALKKLGVLPHDAIVFEDSYSGVQAALGAGIRTIAVRHDFNRNEIFKGTFAILESFQETDKIVSLLRSFLGKDE
jgi:HAD superfamily hydrolase (TIGR01509 family)